MRKLKLILLRIVVASLLLVWLFGGWFGLAFFLVATGSLTLFAVFGAVNGHTVAVEDSATVIDGVQYSFH